MLSDYDNRQLSQMSWRIEQFRRELVRLPALVNDLEALLGCLTFDDDAWRREFERAWGALEDFNALSAEVVQAPRPLESSVFRKALAKLENLIREKLEGILEA